MLWRSAAVHKFTNVEMCRITEELIFQEPYQVRDMPPQVPFQPFRQPSSCVQHPQRHDGVSSL